MAVKNSRPLFTTAKPGFHVFCDKCLSKNISHYEKSIPELTPVDINMLDWLTVRKKQLQEWHKYYDGVQDCVKCKDCGYELCIFRKK